jgi:hypothetical protein
MTWAETRALFGLDDVALKGLLSVKQSGSNAIERMAGIGVRRDKAALSSACKAHPAIRSSRKQSEQSWR